MILILNDIKLSRSFFITILKNHRIQSMEKEKATHLYNRASEHRKEFAELQEMENTLSAELKSESKLVNYIYYTRM